LSEGYKKQHKKTKQTKPDVTTKLARVDLGELTDKDKQSLHELTKQSTSKLPNGKKHD
jgi:hypothetical protein